jgi:hypothetical protein
MDLGMHPRTVDLENLVLGSRLDDKPGQYQKNTGTLASDILHLPPCIMRLKGAGTRILCMRLARHPHEN